MEDVSQDDGLLCIVILLQYLKKAHLAQAIELLETVDALLLSAQLCQVLNMLSSSFF